MGIHDTFFSKPKIPESSLKDLIVKFDDSLEMVSLPKSLILNFGKIGLKPNEWYLFSLIEAFRCEGREVPNQTELAEMMGMTPRNIQVIIADMKAKGLLETKVVRSTNKTIYNFRKLKEKALAFDRQMA